MPPMQVKTLQCKEKKTQTPFKTRQLSLGQSSFECVQSGNVNIFWKSWTLCPPIDATVKRLVLTLHSLTLFEHSKYFLATSLNHHFLCLIAFKVI